MALKDEPSPKCTFLNATSETRLKLRLFSLLRRFATSCSQPARQSQKAWLCTTCATAKHHLISCPKRSKGTLKRGPNATSETRLTPSVQKTAPGWEKCVSKLRNGASATPKQQGPKGRKDSSFCSKDSPRMGKMCFQAQKRRLRHAQTAGP